MSINNLKDHKKVSYLFLAMLLVGLVMDIYHHRPVNMEKEVLKLENWIASKNNEFQADDLNLRVLSSQNRLKSLHVNDKAQAFFVVKGDSILWWDNPFVDFNTSYLNQKQGIYKKENRQYYYNVIEENADFNLVHVIPLNKDGSSNLKMSIIKDAGIRVQFSISENGNYPIRGPTSETLFNVEQGPNLHPPWVDWVLGSIYLLLLVYSLLFLFRNIYNFPIELRKFALFLTVGLSFKTALSTTRFFNRFTSSALFSDEYYMNWLCPSIADLAFLSIIILLLTLALSRYLKSSFDNVRKLSPIQRFGLTFLIMTIGLLVIKLIQHVIFYSDIPFDIEKVFNVRLHTVVAIGSLLISVLAYFIFSFTIYRNYIFPGQGLKEKFVYIIFASGLLIPISIFLQLGIPYLILWVSFISFYFLIDLYIDARRPNITWLIWWMIIIGGLVAILIFKYRSDYTKKQDLEYLNSQIYSQDREFTEKILRLNSTMKANVLAEFFAVPYPFRIEINELERFLKRTSSVYDSLSQQVTVYNKCFDRFGRSVLEGDPSLQLQLAQQEAHAITIDSVTFFDPFLNHYIIEYHFDIIGHPGSPFTFYSIIEHPLKNSLYKGEKPESLFIKSGVIVNADNEALISNFTVLKQQFEQENSSYLTLNGYNYSYAKFEYEIEAITRRPVARLIKPISLFSYIFTLLGFLVVLLSVLNSRYDFLPAGIDLNISGSSSLRNRIQLSVVFLIIVSFLIIGLVTVFYFKTLSINYEKNKILETTYAISGDINERINLINNNSIAAQRIQQSLPAIQVVHNSPIAFYSKHGLLEFASDIEKENKLYYLPYEAVRKFKNQQSPIEIINVRNEDSGDHMQSFLPIYAKSNDLLGFISIPLYPESSFGIDVNDFMGALLNVYVFLFLIAGAIAIAVANSITNPIAELGQKLNRVRLGQRNEPIEWSGKDELGRLIDEYNTMIQKLDESAMLLAKTQRDFAWREMAKQVAHEIKNPLTPMKLSIQYLKKTMSKDADSKALINQVSDTLIEQIDNLSQIASEFSNFAQMPKAQNEKITLNEVVEAIHDLFRKREDMDIVLHEPIDEIYVFADRNQLIRILNNIIKNATQAIPTDRRGKIEIRLHKENNKAVIQISDNGVGIPESERENVFSPYFTTKSSGTGLGLAISVNMIDSCNGRIHFESEVDKGTDFYVEIPLMRLEDNFREDNRVNLDDI